MIKIKAIKGREEAPLSFIERKQEKERVYQNTRSTYKNTSVKAKTSKPTKKGGFKAKAIPCYKVVFSYPDGRTSSMDVRCKGDTTFMIRDVSLGFRKMRGKKGVQGCSIKFYNTKNLGDDSTKLSLKKRDVRYTTLKRDESQSHVKGSQFEKKRLFYEVKY